MPLGIHTILKIKSVCIIVAYTYSYKDVLCTAVYAAYLHYATRDSCLVIHASNDLSPNDPLDDLPAKEPSN